MQHFLRNIIRTNIQNSNNNHAHMHMHVYHFKAVRKGCVYFHFLLESKQKHTDSIHLLSGVPYGHNIHSYSLLLTRFPGVIIQGKQCYEHKSTKRRKPPHGQRVDQLVARLRTVCVCVCVHVRV